MNGRLEHMKRRQLSEEGKDLILPHGITRLSALKLQEGYKTSTAKFYGGKIMPVVVVAVSRERIFDVFTDMIDRLPGTPGVTISDTKQSNPRKEWRREIDHAILMSKLWDYEQLITDDCEFSMIVHSPRCRNIVEIHALKLIRAYSQEFEAFIEIADRHGIPAKPKNMQLVTNLLPEINPREDHDEQFRKLSTDLAMYESNQEENDEFSGSGA